MRSPRMESVPQNCGTYTWQRERILNRENLSIISYRLPLTKRSAEEHFALFISKQRNNSKALFRFFYVWLKVFSRVFHDGLKEGHSVLAFLLNNNNNVSNVKEKYRYRKDESARNIGGETFNTSSYICLRIPPKWCATSERFELASLLSSIPNFHLWALLL